ncbi:hypothetical protein MJO28_004396 [Puccinia striiformis f. sp. tritici]|uniref:Uncharacterized protein n=1 Tax=Puccinia striiformis f. sp. tritici TaxID=168172 RepID=A0ACC0EPP4_9BASI|nr:hypothetical protein MJO28_004396 [Puccinia striiformis f. sp. tritici]
MPIYREEWSSSEQVLPSVANSSFVANVFFPELPLLYNTFVQQRLRNDIRYLRLDTGPCPPTSGFKFHLTTHNPAQALKIQDRPNHNLQPLGRLTVATSPEQNPYSAIPKTPTLIVARQTSDLWSLFKSVIQAFTLPTRNELQRPRISASVGESTQQQGKPYQGIFFEEKQVGRTPGNKAHPSNAAATGLPVHRFQAPSGHIAANQATGNRPQTLPLSFMMAPPLPDSEVQGTVTESTNSQDGSLITLDYCLYVSTCNHLSSSKSKSKNKDDSENIVPLENAMPSMQSNLHNWTWADLRTKIIRIIGSSQHLDAYIACLLNAGQIRFHFYIPNSHACPLRETFL